MPTTTSFLPTTGVPVTGLSAAESARRLAEYGPNDPAPSRKRSAIAALLLLFLNPLAIVLLIAAMFSAFLGQPWMPPSSYPWSSWVMSSTFGRPFGHSGRSSACGTL